MIKKLFNKHLFISVLILFIAIVGASIIPSRTHAATTKEDWDQYKDELTSEGMNRHTTNDLIFSIDDMLSEQTTDEDGNTTYTGALPTVAGIIGSVYTTPPASGVYYAYDVLQNLGGKTAYAQGVGFSGLQPILPIWKAFRNITYVLFALIAIGIGLAIMLRVKISPQAVITINNALPKIIGALILVTFSYAIAGFMIDLMYVFMGLGINILKTGGVNPGLVEIFPGETIFPPEPQTVINSGFYGLFPMFFSSKAGLTLIGALTGGIIGTFTIPFTGTIAGVGIGIILVRVIWLIIGLILLLKLLFGLIKAYIKIILSIILAPLQIMLGAIPGMQIGGFGNWLKGIFAEILIFPAVLLIAMIGTAIVQNIGIEPMWIAPLIGPPQLLGNTGLASIVSGSIANIFVKTIIGMGFLLILAQIPDMIRKLMGQEMDYGAMIGQAFGPARTLGGYGGIVASEKGKQILADRIFYTKTRSGEIVPKGPIGKTVEAIRQGFIKKTTT